MSLHARIDIPRRHFRLRLELRAESGSVTALVGPSGAGKTTTLRGFAGLEDLGAGEILLNGRRLDLLPTAERPIGMVFQDYLLFPHLSALDNVAFGPRARGIAKPDARARAREWLLRVGLTEHADAKPRQLSGGQAQRVALARALAVEPELLLLDEPLSALDADTRSQVRVELLRHLSTYEGVCVLVTHDPADAEMLADRIVTLHNGRSADSRSPSY